MSDSEGESGSQIAAAAPKTFKELGLADPLCDACQKMNFKAPTAIQSAAFGPLSRGSNGLLSAQTGAGKTLAFVLPLLSRLRRGDAYCALVVCPSLELASQLGRSVELLWPAEASSGGGAAQPALRVVQPA